MQQKNKAAKQEEQDYLKESDVESLRSAMLQLDQLTERQVPSQEWFANFIQEQQAVQRKRYRKELLGFLCVAPIAVLSTMISLSFGVGIFLVFHCLVLAGITLPIALRRLKRVDAS